MRHDIARSSLAGRPFSSEGICTETGPDGSPMFDALADRAPFDADRTDTLLVGTLLTLATASAPVVGLLLVGYAVRTTRRRACGDGVPAFDDWRALAGDGVRAAAATSLLHLPAAAVVAVVGLDRMLRGASSLSYLSHYALSPDYAAVAAVAVVALLELVAGYLSVATLVGLARTGSADARLPSVVAELARDRRFVRAFGLTLAVGGGARLARFVLATLPVAGELLGALVSFAGVVVAASVLASVVDGRDDRLASVSGDVGRDGVDSEGYRSNA